MYRNRPGSSRTCGASWGGDCIDHTPSASPCPIDSSSCLGELAPGTLLPLECDTRDRVMIPKFTGLTGSGKNQSQGGGSSSAGPRAECSSLHRPLGRSETGASRGPNRALPERGGEFPESRAPRVGRLGRRSPRVGGCLPRRGLEQTHGQQLEFNG